MNIPMEFIKELVKALEPYFVRKAECAEIQTKNNDKFASENTSLELLSDRLKNIETICKIMATAAIGTFMTRLAEMVFK